MCDDHTAKFQHLQDLKFLVTVTVTVKGSDSLARDFALFREIEGWELHQAMFVKPEARFIHADVKYSFARHTLKPCKSKSRVHYT